MFGDEDDDPFESLRDNRQERDSLYPMETRRFEEDEDTYGAREGGKYGGSGLINFEELDRIRVSEGDAKSDEEDYDVDEGEEEEEEEEGEGSGFQFIYAQGDSSYYKHRIVTGMLRLLFHTHLSLLYNFFSLVMSLLLISNFAVHL